MSWRKHFRVIKGGPQAVQHPLETNRYGGGSGTSANYSSFLPLVYAGHPNRIQRYYQFDDMDKDSDINAALDTIADFCTQSEEQTEELFDFNFLGDPNDSEVSILKTMLDKWVRLNDFHARLWYMVRDTLKNGDSFHLRDPETQEWMWLDHYMVEMVKVNEEDGKTPEEYLIRGLDYNRQVKYGTKKADPNQYRTPFGTSNVGAARVAPISAAGPAAFSLAGTGIDPRQRAMQGQMAQDIQVVDANHVVHLSLSIGNDINWPFGASILEPIFKTFKQKELLEDSIIIYRVQRAPERRIFYIDTGTMPPERAKRHIEAIKNDIHQRRIPNRTGTGGSILDAAYNPLSINDDYFFAQSADGRGSKVETLPGGELTGEIGDLMFFTRKLARGLRVPTSYLNLGEEDGSNANVSFNDGKLGAALIQEHRFSKFCMRLQSLLAPVFDGEFKRYLVKNGIEIEPGLFRLMFTPPQSFTRYRQLELDSQRTQVYAGVAENKILSHRFKLKRYLGLNDDEILENEKLWAEENADKLKSKTGASPAETEASGAGLSDVGIHPGGDMDMDMDMPEGETPEAGAGAMPGGPGATPAGGEAAAAPAAGAPAGAAMPPG